nr:DUF1489 domain-containing protein [Mesobacterium pallidum]
MKLSVGTEGVEDLAAWQAMRAAQMADGCPRHVTRMFPKRRDEILNGGSIYWVIKGFIQCRQRILGLDEVTGEDGIARCAIVLNPELHRTTPAPRRPFQGWRYLAPGDAPADMGARRETDDELPPELAGALADIGVF